MSINFDSGDSSSGLICVGLFFLFVIVLIIAAVISGKKRKQKMQGLVEQIGFTPQARADLELSSALNQLYAPAGIQKIGNLAVKAVGDERYYLFDLTTSSSRSGDSGSTEYNDVGVFSPRFDLPAFMLTQHMSAPAGLGGMIDNLLVRAALTAGFHELQDVTTAFKLSYMLFVRDDARAREVFTDEVLDRIAMLDGAIARGEGRMVVFNRFSLRNSGKMDEVALAQLVDQARQFCGWLSD